VACPGQVAPSSDLETADLSYRRWPARRTDSDFDGGTGPKHGETSPRRTRHVTFRSAASRRRQLPPSNLIRSTAPQRGTVSPYANGGLSRDRHGAAAGALLAPWDVSRLFSPIPDNSCVRSSRRLPSTPAGPQSRSRGKRSTNLPQVLGRPGPTARRGGAKTISASHTERPVRACRRPWRQQLGRQTFFKRWMVTTPRCDHG